MLSWYKYILLSLPARSFFLFSIFQTSMDEKKNHNKKYNIRHLQFKVSCQNDTVVSIITLCYMKSTLGAAGELLAAIHQSSFICITQNHK